MADSKEDADSLETQYKQCVDTISSLKQRILSFHEEHSSILSNYLKSDTAYHPSANKETNGALRFQCRQTFKGHFAKVHALSWSYNGYLASTQDQALIIWTNRGANRVCHELWRRKHQTMGH